MRRQQIFLDSWRLFASTLVLSILLPCAALAQSSLASQFDHFTTGFRLDGAHQLATCESCHVDAIFTGTPTECAGCHIQASRVQASTQPATHILATENCESCHQTGSFAPVARVDHLEVLGTCATCHDGRSAIGQPVNHLPTSNQCDDCHRTTAFVPAVFDHIGIAANCFSCHDGSQAMGKPVNHIPATNVCEDCHNVLMFSPVQRVDHMQVLGTCSTCHNGVIAIGQHPQHIPTTAECDTCHNTISFSP